MSSRCHCLLFVILFFTVDRLIASPSSNIGSCKEARLCCPGRDASCAVQKNKLLNEITEEMTVDRVCYCDSACTSVGDCCYDYQQTCGGECELN